MNVSLQDGLRINVHYIITICFLQRTTLQRTTYSVLLTNRTQQECFDGIKKALGHTQSTTAPLKSSNGEIITDKGQQMERWIEHYSDLYSRENTVSAVALDVIECLPTVYEF